MFAVARITRSALRITLTLRRTPGRETRHLGAARLAAGNSVRRYLSLLSDSGTARSQSTEGRSNPRDDYLGLLKGLMPLNVADFIPSNAGPCNFGPIQLLATAGQPAACGIGVRAVSRQPTNRQAARVTR